MQKKLLFSPYQSSRAKTHKIGSSIWMTQVKKRGPSRALKSRLTLVSIFGVSITPISSAVKAGPVHHHHKPAVPQGGGGGERGAFVRQQQAYLQLDITSR